MARCYSQTTIDGYWWAIKSLTESLGNVEVSELTAVSHSKWVEDMRAKGNSKETIHTNIARYRMFVDYLNLENQIDFKKETIILPKRRRNQHIRFARIWEIDLLIRNASSIRNKAIIATMFSGAIRNSEIRNLKKTDINFAEKKITIEHGKGDKDAELFLTDKAADLLKRYWESRTDTLPWAFVASPTRTGQTSKIASSTLRYIFDSTCHLAGLEGISPKAVRHGHATYLMLKKVPMREIQEAMRHEFITTTQIYTHVLPENMLEDVYPVLNSALESA